MYRALGTVLLLLTLACPPAQAEVVKQTFELDGAGRSFYLFIPESAKSQPAPLLVLFHGSFHDGKSIIKLWKDRAERDGIVLVAPNAAKNDSWRMRQDGPRFMQAVIEAVVSQTPVDGQRIYLFGQSGGAVFALNIAMLESEFFAATAVHAGSWRTPGEFELLPFGKRKIPLAIIVGDRDEYFSLASVRKTEAALKGAGFPVEVTVIPGHHHAITEKTEPDIFEQAWSFLSRCKLEQAPKYTGYKQ